jgi:hypothetical protein
MTYNCKFCGREFPDYNKEAKAHENIPLCGGYNGVILQQRMDKSFIAFVSTGEIITTLTEDGEEIHDSLYNMLVTPDSKHMPQNRGKIAASVIKQYIKGGELTGTGVVESISSNLERIKDTDFFPGLKNIRRFRTIYSE